MSKLEAMMKAAMQRKLGEVQSVERAAQLEQTTVSTAPESHDTAVADRQSQPVFTPTVVPCDDDHTSTDDSSAAPATAPTIKDLSSRAVLVTLRRGTYRPYMRDTSETEHYGAGTVNKHLFEGKGNRVKAANAASGALYTYINQNTAPWMDTGTRVLNLDPKSGHKYDEFMREYRRLDQAAVDAQNDLFDHWKDEVDADYQRMFQIAQAKGKPSLASYSDYPDIDTLRSKYYQELRFMPVPSTGDFRVGISDEDKASLNRAIADAQSNATKHVIKQMLEPMTAAVEKLSVDIGEKGATFRDTLVTNMLDAAERMSKVNMSDDPVIAERIADLRSLVGTYANNIDVLRQSPAVRTKMKTQVEDLMKQMGGLV